MTSAPSRRSFYPAPPSVYPQPLVDPCAAFETTYGHNHCAHTVRDDEFFRARTLNPQSSARLTQTQLVPHLANAAQGSDTPHTSSASTGRVPDGRPEEPAQGMLVAPGLLPRRARAEDDTREARSLTCVPLLCLRLCLSCVFSIYPRHGTGQFTAPYYRRDSKGYRRPFEQPVHVDENYSATKDVSGLVASGIQWSHPSSRPKYAVSRAGSAEGAGATFSTSYRNSGLFDSTSTHTSRVTNAIAQSLQMNRSQQFAAASSSSLSSAANTTRDIQSRPWMEPKSIARNNGVVPSQARPQEVGYYTNDVRDQPPPGAELYSDDQSYRSGLDQALELDAYESNSRAQTARPIIGDQLLADPRENALRKARTVYKRSFGLSQ